MGRSGVVVGVGGFEVLLVVVVDDDGVVEGVVAPRTEWCRVVCRFLLLSCGRGMLVYDSIGWGEESL